MAKFTLWPAFVRFSQKIPRARFLDATCCHLRHAAGEGRAGQRHVLVSSRIG